MPICSACDKPHDRPGRYCKLCHARYMRDWRKSTPLNADQKVRDSARSVASVAKKRGKIAPGPCERCGGLETQMHHPDYRQPLNIKWLCASCHQNWHAFFRKNTVDLWAAWLSQTVVSPPLSADAPDGATKLPEIA